MKCPRCKSANASTERRPGGDSKCLDCGYRAKTTTFQTECTDAYKLGYAEGQRDKEQIKSEALQKKVDELYHDLHEAVVEMCHNCPSNTESGVCDKDKCFVQRWRKTLKKARGE